VNALKHSNTVIPAQAGIQRFYQICIEVLSPLCGAFLVDWIPACAGMTMKRAPYLQSNFWIPACAGMTNGEVAFR